METLYKSDSEAMEYECKILITKNSMLGKKILRQFESSSQNWNQHVQFLFPQLSKLEKEAAGTLGFVRL